MKAIVKETGQTVTITGTSGEGSYRVFLGGKDIRYDWYYEHELILLNKENK